MSWFNYFLNIQAIAFRINIHVHMRADEKYHFLQTFYQCFDEVLFLADSLGTLDGESASETLRCLRQNSVVARAIKIFETL